MKATFLKIHPVFFLKTSNVILFENSKENITICYVHNVIKFFISKYKFATEKKQITV